MTLKLLGDVDVGQCVISCRASRCAAGVARDWSWCRVGLFNGELHALLGQVRRRAFERKAQSHAVHALACRPVRWLEVCVPGVSGSLPVPAPAELPRPGSPMLGSLALRAYFHTTPSSGHRSSSFFLPRSTHRERDRVTRESVGSELVDGFRWSTWPVSMHRNVVHGVRVRPSALSCCELLVALTSLYLHADNT